MGAPGIADVRRLNREAGAPSSASAETRAFVSAGAKLSLTPGTVEARATGLHDALDAAGRRELAVAARASLSLMLIDPPAMLEIAELAIGLDIVAQGGAAGGDGFAQNIGDGAGQPLAPLPLHRAPHAP